MEPAPTRASQLPPWAKWAIVAVLAVFAVVTLVLLFATGGLSFTGGT